ncbi:hypothetical protein [Pilimelia columellifera]
MIEDLMGRQVDVTPGDPFKTDDLPSSVVALYADDMKKLVAVIGLDLPLAAYAGAALGLMPVGGAEDAVTDRKLSPALLENVSELCNILAGLLNREGGPHVRLHQVVAPGDSLPNDAAAYLLAVGRRLDVNVTISRYGGGRLAIALAE